MPFSLSSEPNAPRAATIGFPDHLLGLGVRVVFTVVAVLAVYLAIQSFSGVLGVGCGVECATVLGSNWAKVFGVPVSALGVATYLIILATYRSGKPLAFLCRLALALVIAANVRLGIIIPLTRSGTASNLWPQAMQIPLVFRPQGTATFSDHSFFYQSSSDSTSQRTATFPAPPRQPFAYERLWHSHHRSIPSQHRLELSPLNTSSFDEVTRLSPLLGA